MGSLDIGGDLGDFEVRWPSWRVRAFDVRPMGWFLTLDQEQLYHVERWQPSGTSILTEGTVARALCGVLVQLSSNSIFTSSLWGLTQGPDFKETRFMQCPTSSLLSQSLYWFIADFRGVVYHSLGLGSEGNDRRKWEHENVSGIHWGLG